MKVLVLDKAYGNLYSEVVVKSASILIGLVSIAILVTLLEVYLATIAGAELEPINMVLDIVLVALGGFTIQQGKRVENLFGGGFVIIFWGLTFLAFAHIAETFLFLALPEMDVALHETIHRLIVFTGFAAILIAFRRIGSAS